MNPAINLIIVDIQPMYYYWCKKTINYLMEAINAADRIFYYFNGEDVGSSDTDDCIVDMLDMNNEQIEKTIFVEKYYGFLRDWMDAYVDDETIIQTIVRRDKGEEPTEEEEELTSSFGMIYDPHLLMPPIEFAHICGGQDQLCLKEMELLLTAKGVKTKRIDKCVW